MASCGRSVFCIVHIYTYSIVKNNTHAFRMTNAQRQPAESLLFCVVIILLVTDMMQSLNQSIGTAYIQDICV